MRKRMWFGTRRKTMIMVGGSELRNGGRASMIAEMMTTRVGWYLILMECILFANSFPNYFIYINVFNPPQPFHGGKCDYHSHFFYTYGSQHNISGCLK